MAARVAMSDTGICPVAVDGANRVIEQCLTGEQSETNMLPQLMHLYGENSKAVIKALCDKIGVVIANTLQNKNAAQRAGTLLVNAVLHLDGGSASVPSDGAASTAPACQARCTLLDHVIVLTGGQNKTIKDPAIRAQGCALITVLAAAVPGHKGAEEKLLQYALDKIPSIREKAVRGLAALAGSQAAVRALAGLTTDYCTAVRASAVRALPVLPITSSALLERINDVEACVRAQLFHRLETQPQAVDSFRPAALARLIVGLVDRNAPVRAAAGAAVDVWREHVGGALRLIARCDVMADEALGCAIAGALAARYPAEGAGAARQWLHSKRGRRDSGKDGKPDVGSDVDAPLLLMARFALVCMSDEQRDDVLDAPSLIERAQEVLDASPPVWKNDEQSRWCDFLLRQLLQVVAMVDVGDEQLRRDVEQLAENVLLRSPIPARGNVNALLSRAKVQYSAIDLSVVILRKCSGLSHNCQVRTRKHQALENRFSTRMVLLMSDLCQPYEGGESEASFAGRLSRQLQKLNTAIDELLQIKSNLQAQKKKAIAEEDFMLCHELKDRVKRNALELSGLQEKSSKLQEERDGVCLRVTAMIVALLRWSSSELRWDPALFGTLQTILQPMVVLPALSEDVDIAAITAICLFCTRDGDIARAHWSLLLQLVRNLREGTGSKRLIRARATVAARALADCARLHGNTRTLDRDEVLGAALSLAAVPFHARHLVLEPLCGWLISLGHVFFEEHLLDPVLEVQWALGWMLVEAFRQQRRYTDDDGGDSGKSRTYATPSAEDLARSHSGDVALAIADGTVEEDADEDLDPATAMQVLQFFTLLPKLGLQGAPLLSLAVESVAESGLWRRAVLQPQSVGFHTRFVRTFAWPQLFAFASERLPPEMRFRLWKCSLQLCVTSPVLAPLAEIPFALANAIVAGQAPPGAAELVHEAIELGADPAALAALQSRLPPVKDSAADLGPWLVPHAEAEAAECARRADLVNLGIVDLDQWAPSTVAVPEVLPPNHRMRQAAATRRAGRVARGGASSTATMPGTPSTMTEPSTPHTEAAPATPQETPVRRVKGVTLPEADAPEVTPVRSVPGSTTGQAPLGEKPSSSMPPPAKLPARGKKRQQQELKQELPTQEPEKPTSASDSGDGKRRRCRSKVTDDAKQKQDESDIQLPLRQSGR
eukprot:TRINITY_DN43553_c0_g1_i1.p1 TRINITY_DN43553_c0_g1~~TRINITY_DN43553_c0_g1_i1.p1  ORF type:complete len:1172 (-),score=206.86 TRINITY_DN43553_c0_g1_i1:339-3854(-)